MKTQIQTYRGHIIVVSTTTAILWLSQFSDVACFARGYVTHDDDLMESEKSFQLV